jgi:hypothetical protein
MQYARVPSSGSASVGVGDFVVYGFPTTTANMPVAGAATWTGVGAGVFAAAVAPSSFDFLGDATLNIDFGARTVSGAINNIIYADAVNVITPSGGGINSIALHGAISGGAFSGSAVVDFVSNPDLTAPMVGRFFGPNNGPPVEAGGAFSGANVAGHVFGGFVVGAP